MPLHKNTAPDPKPIHVSSSPFFKASHRSKAHRPKLFIRPPLQLPNQPLRSALLQNPSSTANRKCSFGHRQQPPTGASPLQPLRLEFADLESKQKWENLLLKSENQICADCSASNPTAASTNNGVFICFSCSEVHRSLGEHISKVLDINSDEWSDVDIEYMTEVGGNACANSIYEEFLPKDFVKPTPESTNKERTKFIRSKYESQEFLKPSLRIVISKPQEDSNNEVISSNLNKLQLQLKSNEYLGALKVKVIKGTNLAVRDILTSDPYVILTLGQQRLKTSVMASNLNPIWNEEFELLVPQQNATLKIQVYDHEKLFVDDTMGEAEIDIQPIVTAGLTFEDADVLENMQIGKWLRTTDNALMEDSTINVVDGKIKQDILLKLQRVESGEVQIQLEWLPFKHSC